MRRRILRLLARLLVGVGAIILLLSGAIRLDQYLLRWRAERLQSDIRSLELRKSTYADARKIIDRWWDDAREQGPCRPDWCDVEIGFSDFSWGHTPFNMDTPARDRIVRWLGVRPAAVDAAIRVRNNLVVGKRIGGYILGRCIDSDGQTFCTTMIGHASTRRFTELPRIVDVRHPEYTFYKPSGCEGCVDADVIFSPYASAADVQRLTDVNFGCITRWTPCENEEDILPTAWAEAQREGVPPAQVASCSETIRALTRELGCVPLATVRSVIDIGEGPQINLRWENECALRMLENQNTLAGLSRELHLREGDRLLVFEEQLFHTSYPCSIVAATQENLNAAQQGVSEDLSDHFKVYFAPGLIDPNIHPPNVKVQ
jgi:hypothetical protein